MNLATTMLILVDAVCWGQVAGRVPPARTITAATISSVLNCVSASGSATAYTCPSSRATSCDPNLEVVWTPDVDSGSAPTLDVGCGAKPILTNEAAVPSPALFAASVPVKLWYDGKSWRAPVIVPGPTGGTVTGDLSVSAALLEPGQGLNIMAKGAKCDGTTDDAAAINAAFSVSNDVIVPHSKVCAFASTVTVPSGATFHGGGKTSELLWKGGNTAGIQIASGATNSHITDLDIESSVAGTGIGIQVLRSANVNNSIERVRLRSFATQIQWGEPGYVAFGGVISQVDMNLSGAQVGIDGYGSNAVTIRDSYIRGYHSLTDTVLGIRLNNSHGNHISGGDIEGNPGGNIILANSTGILIDGVYFEGYGTPGLSIQADSASAGLHVIGNRFRDTASSINYTIQLGDGIAGAVVAYNYFVGAAVSNVQNLATKSGGSIAIAANYTDGTIVNSLAGVSYNITGPIYGSAGVDGSGGVSPPLGLVSAEYPSADLICAQHADFLSGAPVCNNQVVDGTTLTAFGTSYTIPGGTLAPGVTYRVKAIVKVWSSASAAALGAVKLFYGPAAIAESINYMIMTNGVTNGRETLELDWTLTAASASSLVVGWTAMTSVSNVNANYVPQPVSVVSSSDEALSLKIQYTANTAGNGWQLLSLLVYRDK
jgi:hypothetical protein